MKTKKTILRPEVRMVIAQMRCPSLNMLTRLADGLGIERSLLNKMLRFTPDKQSVYHIGSPVLKIRFSKDFFIFDFIKLLLLRKNVNRNLSDGKEQIF